MFKKSELLSKYTLGVTLGSGSYAEVKKAQKRVAARSGVAGDTGATVAVKTIDRKKVEVGSDIAREIEILKQIKHPHVISFIDAFEEKKYVHIVLE